MKQLTIEDAKQIELEILDYIDILCKKHNINYIINYGTLIGAVRHEGFIPWDDDIDLSMPREDYQRFINIFQKEKSKYKLLSLETDKNYFNNFIKITDSTTKIIDTRNTKTYESGDELLINESDVTLAEASNAFIVGFNVRPTPQARQQAEADDVEIRLHSIIYKVIEEMEEAMKGMLDPEFEEKVIGEAVIRETFKVSKVGTIGGFMVINGKVTRDSKVRVIRDGVVIYDGELASLKHYKDDVKEVTNGREGGLMIDGYNDIKMDDVIEAYVMEEIKR